MAQRSGCPKRPELDFYLVAATDKLGCFNSQDVNIWINCRRANA